MEFAKRQTAFHTFGKIINALVKLGVIFCFLFPFYWMLITSVKPYEEIIIFPPTFWPENWTWEAYETIFTSLNLGQFFLNSVLITFFTIVLQVVIMVPSAYAFARYQFRGKNILFGMVMVAFMIPVQITFITTYLQMASWKLLPTLLPQILPFGANAFGIFLLRQAFMQIPEELIESARLDNAGELRIITSVMLPMCKSTFVTIALFSCIGTWNSYFWPLVMTNSDQNRPLTIAIQQLKDLELGVNWNIMMAGNAILALPVLLLFLFASKKIVRAFAYKGMK